MTTTMTFPSTVDEMVALYVKLRDRIKEADDQHKEKTRSAKEYLEALNNQMLNALNVQGADSIKTSSGTVYRKERASATIQDALAFRDCVISNELWDLADWRANAVVVEEYIKMNGAPPPGVNYTTMLDVGVRRA